MGVGLALLKLICLVMCRMLIQLLNDDLSVPISVRCKLNQMSESFCDNKLQGSLNIFKIANVIIVYNFDKVLFRYERGCLQPHALL